MEIKKNKFFFNRKASHNSYITKLGEEKSLSLDLTHSPSKNHKNEYLKLTKNPNPLDDDVAYLSFVEREFKNIHYVRERKNLRLSKYDEKRLHKKMSNRRKK